MSDHWLREREAMQSRIDELYERCKTLQKRVNQLEPLEQGGRFWLRMQRHIADNPNVRDSWLEFFTIYAMCVPYEELK